MSTWNITEVSGYQPLTTFWEDFTIADRFGLLAIKDTYSRAFKEWKGNYKYLTELVMVLNCKIWEHWNKGDREKAGMYDGLWRTADEYACNNLKADELRYFFDVTD